MGYISVDIKSFIEICFLLSVSIVLNSSCHDPALYQLKGKQPNQTGEHPISPFAFTIYFHSSPIGFVDLIEVYRKGIEEGASIQAGRSRYEKETRHVESSKLESLHQSYLKAVLEGEDCPC